MKDSGYIYIMVNPTINDGQGHQIIKIGYSIDPDKRAKQISTETGVPAPYEVYATYETKLPQKGQELQDKEVHRLIDSLNPDIHYCNREFFQMTAEEGYALLETIAKISNTESRLRKRPKFMRSATKAESIKQNSKAKSFRPVDGFDIIIPEGVQHHDFKSWKDVLVRYVEAVAAAYPDADLVSYNPKFFSHSETELSESACPVLASCGIWVKTCLSKAAIRDLYIKMNEQYPAVSLDITWE